MKILMNIQRKYCLTLPSLRFFDDARKTNFFVVINVELLSEQSKTLTDGTITFLLSKTTNGKASINLREHGWELHHQDILIQEQKLMLSEAAY